MPLIVPTGGLASAPSRPANASSVAVSNVSNADASSYNAPYSSVTVSHLSEPVTAGDGIHFVFGKSLLLNSEIVDVDVSHDDSPLIGRLFKKISHICKLKSVN